MSDSASSSLSVLILGATGIIGRELSSAALDAGHAVTAVSRGLRPESGPVDSPTMRYVSVDVYRTEQLGERLKGQHYDVVVDLVSFDTTHLSSLLGLFNGNCSQYIFVSSATIYDSSPPGERIVETSPRVDGPWSYPLQKLECERLLAKQCLIDSQVFTIVRPYITYSDQRLPFGIWESNTMVERIANGRPVVLGDELANATTSLTHSADLARGMIALMGNPAASNQDVHIVNEDPLTWLETYAITADVLGVELCVESAPVRQVLGAFPELRGKLSDRLLDRSFDNHKFLSICPEFSFEFSPRIGYQYALESMLRRGLPPSNYGIQGRLDRLVAVSSGSGLAAKGIAQFAATDPRPPAKATLRYAVGRSGFLSWINRSVGRRHTGSPSDAAKYGLK